MEYFEGPVKYHSTFSTIAISIAVLLAFAAVALGVVAVLSMTSPTLIATNTILEELSSADTPLTISFGSMDRNFRDGVFINELEIGYEGESVASFDRVTVHMGLFSLLRYAAFGSGSLEVEAEGGTITIPEGMGGGSAGASDPSSFSLPPVLDNYSITLRVHDTDASIMGAAKLSDIDARITLDHGIDGLMGEVKASSIAFSESGIDGSAEGAAVSFSYDEGINADLSISSAAVSYDGYEGTVGKISASAFIPLSFDLKEAEARVSAEDISAKGEEGWAKVSDLNASYKEDLISASIDGASASVLGIDASIAHAEASTADADNIKLVIEGIDASRDGVTLLSSDMLDLAISIVERSISIASESADTGLISEGTDIFPLVSLGSLQADATLSDDGIRFSALTSAVFSSEEEEFSGTALDLRLSGLIRDGKADDVSIEISDLRLPGVDESARLSISYEDESLRFSGRYGRYLSVLGSYDGNISLSLMASDLRLYPFRPLISFFLPALSEYIGADTSATGSVNIGLEEGVDGLTGPASLSFSLKDIRFNNYSFSASTAFSMYLEKESVRVDSASINADPVAVEWKGSVDRAAMLPEGEFRLIRTSTGDALAIAVLELSDSREYSFALTIPDAPSVSFSGHVDFSTDNLISSAATLSSGDNIYPIDVTVDLASDTITLYNPQLSVNVEYGDGVYGNALFSSFALPVPSPDVAPCILNGSISASFVFSAQRLELSVPSFQIENMRHLPTSPDLSFTAEGDNDGLRISSIILSGIETEPLRGALELSLPSHSFVLYLSSSRSDEREEIRLSIYEEDSVISGIFRADNLNFARIGLEGLNGDINLTGSGGSFPTLAFSGSVTASSTDANRPGALSASLSVSSDEINLSDILYEREGLRVESPSLSFSSRTGEFSTSASVYAAMLNSDRAYPVTTSLSLTASFGEEENLFRSIMAFISDEGIGEASGSLSFGRTAIDNRIFIEPRESEFRYSSGSIEADGSLLDGYFDIPSRSFDLTLDLDPLADVTLSGILTDSGFEMKADIRNFEISVVNIFFPVPTVTFIDPAPSHGTVYIVKDGIEWDLYGKAEAETVAFDLFWMPDERVILHNPSFIVWENSITSLIDDCSVLDLNTFERLPGRVSLGVDLSPTLSLTQWSVDVYVRDGEEVGIRLPVPASNVDIWGDVSGHLSVVGYDNFVHLGGDITADDLQMSIGMEPMPEWWGTRKTTIMDMNLLLRSNVSFVLPLGPDPILTAMLAENQRISVSIPETGGLSISGNLDIRSGEFFYFQKNFYITEGSIGFPETGYGEASFNPIINLRARLKDFDSDGRPVDIFLVLRNATLDNISPTFESSPNKDINEIMSILGGAILPTGVYGDVSVSSVFSLVSASVDILSRVGILRSADNGLEASIRNSLSLDTFSIHTNIVENILYDTVSLASSNLREDNVSPMARYLNGTTLYLGKYISPELYFEGMVHLQSSTDREDVSHSFIADDLDLDIELSLEWNNPMCTVTFFTRPGNITIYDVMDTFGFELSKRIVW